jgi:DNA repair exonuclease SbcCD ATPase subunit
MKSWIFIGILVAMMSGAAYYYYSTTQTRIATLIENNAVLESNNLQLQTANETNLRTIDNLRASYKKVEQQFAQVQTEFQVIRSQNNELRERLGRHELGALAAVKPGLVQPIINKASADALRCFELLSGAPLNERERKATNEKDFNNECPWLYHELVTP